VGLTTSSFFDREQPAGAQAQVNLERPQRSEE
jgi:hypothetical protein